ncbi:MAG: exosortase A [Telluria sp.]
MYLTPPTAVVDANRASLSGSAWFLIALAFLAPFALYFDTARSVVSIWNASETYAHGYVILPIALWLVWRKRENFSTMPPTPYWPALVLLAGAGAGWLVAGMGEVRVVQQYALASMIPIVALAVFGPRLAKSLAFPLLFVLFAVPFGEVFIGPLIEFTADFTIRAVQLTGIPVLRNGTRFEIPTGSWSVVEACSGVRYLISSVTLGSLYAYLTYHSAGRRALFVALSVVVPIIANGLRAYMSVMIGHTSGMTLAVGVDHLIYGWVFFGLVMFLMFWIGSFWRQDAAPQSPTAAVAAAPQGGASRAALLRIVLAACAIAALWPAFGVLLDRAAYNPEPVRLEAPAVAWAPAEPFTEWKPGFMAPDARFRGVFKPAQAGATPVGLEVLYYRNQTHDKALVSSINILSGSDDLQHHEMSANIRTEESSAGNALAVREAVMRGPRGNYLVWHWIWVDGRATTSAMKGKLWQAKAKLLMHGDDGAAVILSAPYDDNPEMARAAMRAFLAENKGALDAALEKTRGTR